MNWTTDLPTEDGFYWYWEEQDSQPEIVRFDRGLDWIYSCGSEIARGPDMTYKITGYFWPEKLTPPAYTNEK